ncbi:MAG: hypothetical protein GKS06_12860 [Acidobacteria bacterium]|nr:hypothetical protein [Acidobacteriota bacterium]
MKDLERILVSDPVIEPSPDFAKNVMAQVRTEAAAPAPIDFPWRRFLPGVITAAAAILIFVVMVIANFDPASLPAETQPAAPVFDSALLQETPVIAAAAVLGSLVLAWLTVRFTALPRSESF